MNVRTFVLKTDDGEIYAVGMSITQPSGDLHNVVFRPGFNDDKSLVIQTRSPERAEQVVGFGLPVMLEWWNDRGCGDTSFAAASADVDFYTRS